MNRKTASVFDVLYVLGAAALTFGCIASSHRTARTTEPGQGSVSVSYLQANNLNDGSAERIRLLGVDSRFGLARGIDMGLAHTWDITARDKNTYASVWTDLLFQTTNRDNEIGVPIFSFGLLKGYVYNKSAHVTGIPVMVSLRVNPTMTATVFYRHEYISGDLLPKELHDPRSSIGAGFEIALSDATEGGWTPKIGLAVGTFNSLTGGKGDSGLILNLGFTVDSPLPH